MSVRRANANFNTKYADKCPVCYLYEPTAKYSGLTRWTTIKRQRAIVYLGTTNLVDNIFFTDQFLGQVYEYNKQLMCDKEFLALHRGFNNMHKTENSPPPTRANHSLGHAHQPPPAPAVHQHQHPQQHPTAPAFVLHNIETAPNPFTSGPFFAAPPTYAQVAQRQANQFLVSRPPPQIDSPRPPPVPIHPPTAPMPSADHQQPPNRPVGFNQPQPFLLDKEGHPLGFDRTGRPHRLPLDANGQPQQPHYHPLAHQCFYQDPTPVPEGQKPALIAGPPGVCYRRHTKAQPAQNKHDHQTQPPPPGEDSDQHFDVQALADQQLAQTPDQGPLSPSAQRPADAPRSPPTDSTNSNE